MLQRRPLPFPALRADSPWSCPRNWTCYEPGVLPENPIRGVNRWPAGTDYGSNRVHALEHLRSWRDSAVCSGRRGVAAGGILARLDEVDSGMVRASLSGRWAAAQSTNTLKPHPSSLRAGAVRLVRTRCLSRRRDGGQPPGQPPRPRSCRRSSFHVALIMRYPPGTPDQGSPCVPRS